MFKAKEKGLNAKVVNRNLIVKNSVFHVDNIPSDLKPPQSSLFIDNSTFGLATKPRERVLYAK